MPESNKRRIPIGFSRPVIRGNQLSTTMNRIGIIALPQYRKVWACPGSRNRISVRRGDRNRILTYTILKKRKAH